MLRPIELLGDHEVKKQREKVLFFKTQFCRQGRMLVCCRYEKYYSQISCIIRLREIPNRYYAKMFTEFEQPPAIIQPKNLIQLHQVTQILLFEETKKSITLNEPGQLMIHIPRKKQLKFFNYLSKASKSCLSRPLHDFFYQILQALTRQRAGSVAFLKQHTFPRDKIAAL